MKNSCSGRDPERGKNVRIKGTTKQPFSLGKNISDRLAREIWEEMNSDLIVNTDFIHF
jgi:nucleoid DNA-binding protein